MSQVEIKNRWTGAVLFTAELGAEYASESTSVRMGAAVKLAISSRAVLRDAVLSDADLRDADLRGAVLSGADLRGADLRGAVLSGAVLSDAELRDADLRGAVLRGDLRLIGNRPILQLGPIGSRSAYFMAYLTDKGLHLRAGCFFGTRAELEAKLASEHGDNEHAQEYRAALEFIAVHERLWTPADSKSEAA